MREILILLLLFGAAAAYNCSSLGIEDSNIFTQSTININEFGEGLYWLRYFDAPSSFSLEMTRGPFTLFNELIMTLYMSPAEETLEPDANSYRFMIETSSESPTGVTTVSSSVSECYAIKIRASNPDPPTEFLQLLFTLRVFDLNDPPTPTARPSSKCGRLFPGQQNSYESFINQNSSVESGEYKYYFFSASSNADITIALSSDVGSTDLLISDAERYYYPSLFTSQGKSDSIKYTDILVWSTERDEMCIAIGVVGSESYPDSSFSLNVSEDRRSSHNGSGSGLLGFYIFLGIFFPLLACVVTVAYLRSRRTTSPSQAAPIDRPGSGKDATAMIQAEPISAPSAPEIREEGEAEVGGTSGSVSPPAHSSI